MAGNQSRNKGANAEREIVRMLQPIVDKIYKVYDMEEIPLLERNTLQCNKGGSDIAGLEWMALEIKRQETLDLDKWWEQSRAATKKGQTTILLYRQNGRKWRCQTHGALIYGNDIASGHSIIRVDFNIEDFLDWFANKVETMLLIKSKQQGIEIKRWPPAPPKD
jgi:hypothetical protein